MPDERTPTTADLFYHRRTVSGMHSGQALRVAEVLGPGTLPGAHLIRDEHGAIFNIRYSPDTNSFREVDAHESK